MTDVATTELAVPDYVLDVRTGEMLPATPDNAARSLMELREYRAKLMDAVRACEAVLLAESARQGTKTLHLAGQTANINTKTEYVWDMEILEELHELGLPEDRWHDLVTETISYKVKAAVAAQLAKANPDYARVIEAARSTVEKPPYVGVGSR